MIQTDYYEKNYSCLKVNKKELAEELERELLENEAVLETVQTETAANGDIIPVLVRENRSWALNSRYEPNEAAKMYAERYDKVQPYSILYVFGFSDGRAIRQLLTKLDDTNQLIIYEPCRELLIRVLHEIDCTDIFSDKRAILLTGKLARELLDDCITLFLDYSRSELIDYLILPNYDVLFYSECEAYMNQIVHINKKVVIDRNTMINLQDGMTKNTLYNLYDMVSANSLGGLKEALDKIDLTGIPAIIVAAGPSLDKNIAELKAAEGKAFIFVVDAALKAAVKADIQYQVGVTVDAKKNLSLFEDEVIRSRPILTEPVGPMKFLEKHRGKKLYSYGYGADYLKQIAKDELPYQEPMLSPGGSVATVSFSYAKYLGFKTIILVGQDLAFTGNRGHVSTVYNSIEENEEHVKNSPTQQMVEGIDGQPILTDFQMSMYIKWFEDEIEKAKDSLRVIDATEGGARKKGAILMTLREAIKQECHSETKIDFDSLIEHLEPTIAESKQRGVYRKLKKLPKRLEELRGRLEEGIQHYDELASCASQKELDIEQITRLQAAIEEDNQIEQEPEMYLVDMYAKRAEYELKEDIFRQEDMGIDEIARKGRRMLEGYLQAICDLEQEMPILLDRITDADCGVDEAQAGMEDI